MSGYAPGSDCMHAWSTRNGPGHVCAQAHAHVHWNLRNGGIRLEHVHMSRASLHVSCDDVTLMCAIYHSWESCTHSLMHCLVFTCAGPTHQSHVLATPDHEIKIYNPLTRHMPPPAQPH